MANNNKTIYIIVGIVLAVIAIPVVIMVLGLLGGMFYWMQGTAN